MSSYDRVFGCLLDEGSCFGVSDPSRLRFYSEIDTRTDSQPFKLDEERVNILCSSRGNDVFVTLDKKLATGFRARVVPSREGADDWLKEEGKPPYSDIDSKQIHYIYQEF